MLTIQHQASVGSGNFALWLPAHRVVRPYLGQELPQRLEEPLVVLGGTMSACDDEANPWLPQVRQLIRQGLEREIPVLGICLGAQLLCVAAGGGVSVHDAAGAELGVTQVRLSAAAAQDEFCTGLPAEFPVISDHRDGLSPLPEGATLLGESDRYRQIFRVGQRAWGVQFHPEVQRHQFRSWAEEDIVLLPDSSPAALSKVLRDAGQQWGCISQYAQQLAQNFGRIARGWEKLHR